MISYQREGKYSSVGFADGSVTIFANGNSTNEDATGAGAAAAARVTASKFGFATSTHAGEYTGATGTITGKLDSTRHN